MPDSSISNSSETFACSTKGRPFKERIFGLIYLFIGLTIAHFGVALFILSDLGTDTFTVFIQGLAHTVGLSIGTCHVMVLILLTVIMAILTRGYIKAGSVVCAFCGGWIIDFFMWCLNPVINSSLNIVLRIAIMLTGCVILSIGMSVVIESHAGTGPNDLIAIILTDKLRKTFPSLQFRTVRIICDVLFTAIGFILGGNVGIGTVAAAFLTGPLVQFFLPKSRSVILKLNGLLLAKKQ